MKELGCDGTVISEKRQGKGMAVRKAFNEIDADYYVMVDADMTYDPEEVHTLLKPVVDGEQDMVVGDRHSSGMYKSENKRKFHNFGNSLVTKIINMLFKSSLVDILSGYRVFSRRFVKTFPITCAGFEIETEMTLHALDKRFQVKEIPVNYKDRPEGSFSKINTFSDGIRILRTIMWVFKDYRPLLFFGSLSLLFAVLGILMGLPVLYEYIEYKFIYRVPSAILATGLMIFSLLFFGIGLILDTVAKFQRFNYELHLLGGKGRHGR
jgi:glycosyltransferase involved in cell wall biosynthesis